jgi:hypothetical protein
MPPARHGHAPRFPLATIQRLVRDGQYSVTRTANETAQALYLNVYDIEACVCGLEEADYSHTLAGERFPGTFQDVYRTRFGGYAIYLKVQIAVPEWVTVISFKKDESA